MPKILSNRTEKPLALVESWVGFQLLFVCFCFTRYPKFCFTHGPSIHPSHRLGNFDARKIVRNIGFKPKIAYILWIQIIFPKEHIDPLKQLPAQIPALLPRLFRHNFPVVEEDESRISLGESEEERVHSMKIFGPVTALL